MTARPHVVYVLTSSLAARRMFGGHGRLWRAANLRVTVISAPGTDLERFGLDEDVDTVGVPIERELNLFRDIVSLYRLWREFRRLRPQLVECGTPKAGLLGVLAARLAGVPAVIYTLHGLRLETLRGWRRAVLLRAEQLTVKIADETIAVSPSLLRRARELGVLGKYSGVVAGPGSAAGIDAARFADTARHPRKSQTIGFVGRLTRDKGIVELIEAFGALKTQRSDVRLLLVGDFEEGDPLPAAVRESILGDPAILLTGFVDDATPYYADIDIVALPSYREGFPLVALEAAAAARPIVAADCTGMCDAVVDGKTGLIVPVADVQALADRLLRLLDSPETATQIGQAARGRVLRQFQPDLIWAEKRDLYTRLFEDMPIGRPLLQSVAKRAFDAAAALALIVLFSPLIAVIALTLLAMGDGVFFSQARPGMRGRPFVVHKFQSMSNERTASGELLADDQRLTRFGRFLRRWSLDELPQLCSVLRGEMSLVGPRPLLSEYLSRYSPRQAKRLLAPPGLTGWAQVNGRNQSDWDTRLELDVWYVENWSLWLDARILVRTLGIVLTGRGVEARESATPTPFLGVLHRRS